MPDTRLALTPARHALLVEAALGHIQYDAARDEWHWQRNGNETHYARRVVTGAMNELIGAGWIGMAGVRANLTAEGHRVMVEGADIMKTLALVARLTPAQRRVLRAIHGGQVDAGRNETRSSLTYRGMLDDNGLTDLGRRVVAQLPEVPW